MSNHVGLEGVVLIEQSSSKEWSTSSESVECEAVLKIEMFPTRIGDWEGQVFIAGLPIPALLSYIQL